MMLASLSLMVDHQAGVIISAIRQWRRRRGSLRLLTEIGFVIQFSRKLIKKEFAAFY